MQGWLLVIAWCPALTGVFHLFHSNGGFQDDTDNVTRFLVLAREPILPTNNLPFKACAFSSQLLSLFTASCMDVACSSFLELLAAEAFQLSLPRDPE